MKLRHACTCDCPLVASDCPDGLTVHWGCGGYVPFDTANDTPAVLVEIRAAEIAADTAGGVGLGGHRPDHCTGEHCWHFYADEDGGPCCYCDRDYPVLPGIDNACRVGQIARAIAEHDKDHP